MDLLNMGNIFDIEHSFCDKLKKYQFFWRKYEKEIAKTSLFKRKKNINIKLSGLKDPLSIVPKVKSHKSK
jgi:hypothetical protein